MSGDRPPFFQRLIDRGQPQSPNVEEFHRILENVLNMQSGGFNSPYSTKRSDEPLNEAINDGLYRTDQVDQNNDMIAYRQDKQRRHAEISDEDVINPLEKPENDPDFDWINFIHSYLRRKK